MCSTYTGIGASSGRAEGPVHWVSSPKDLETFQVGEVLFAKMTSPDWGEIFQKAAGVVTEQGGMLCHAAIVAREEGVPAVVGVGGRLSEVANGSTVSINGDDGTVAVKQ